MAKHGKKFTKAKSQVDSEKNYSLADACKLVTTLKFAKFDESVDVCVKLGVDPRHADQVVRGALKLPNGTGKSVRVAVFAKGAKATEAEAAGADVVGGPELAKKVEEGFLDFDKVVATPDMMATVGKLGRVLGPRNMMPNPKMGTVTMDVSAAVADLKGGKVEFRVDKNGNLHTPVGRASFSPEKLEENLKSLFALVMRSKPASVKGQYVRKVSLATTMGPGIRLDPQVVSLSE